MNIRSFALIFFLQGFGFETAMAAGEVENVRFGVLRQAGDQYVLAEETARIPRLYKDSGFRFGISFENPRCVRIEWYEVVHLPAPVRQTSGDLRQVEPQALKS